MRATIAVCIGVALVLVWAYGSTLSGHYLSDDFWLLRFAQDESSTPSAGRVLEHFARPVRDEALPLFYRPMWRASYLLDRAVFGADPLASRLLGLVLHGAACVMLFFVVSRATVCRWVGGLTTLLFAVHPGNVEAVVWPASRTDVLAQLFLLAGLLAMPSPAFPSAKGRKVVVLLCVLAAATSKEPGMLLVPILAAAWWWCPQQMSGGVRSRLAELFRATWLLWAAFSALLLARWLLLGTVVGGYASQGRAPPLDAAALLTRWEAIVRLACPWSRDPVTETITAVLWIGLVGWAWRRGTSVCRNAIAFAAAWLLLLLLPLHGLPMANTPAGSRWLHLVTAPFAMLTSVALWVMAGGSGRLTRLLPFALGGAVVVSGFAAAQLNERRPHERAGRLGRVLFGGIERVLPAAGETTVLYGVPEFRDGVAFAANAFPSCLRAPFVEETPHGDLVVLMQEKLERGALLEPLAGVLDRLPDVRWVEWQQDGTGFLPVAIPRLPVQARGRLSVDAAGTARLSPQGWLLAGTQPGTPNAGSFVEIEGKWRASGSELVVDVERMIPASPALESSEGEPMTVQLRAAPGSHVVLLQSGEQAFVPLGAAGTLQVAHPQAIGPFPVPEAGLLRVPLPTRGIEPGRSVLVQALQIETWSRVRLLDLIRVTR